MSETTVQKSENRWKNVEHRVQDLIYAFQQSVEFDIQVEKDPASVREDSLAALLESLSNELQDAGILTVAQVLTLSTINDGCEEVEEGMIPSIPW